MHTYIHKLVTTPNHFWLNVTTALQSFGYCHHVLSVYQSRVHCDKMTESRITRLSLKSTEMFQPITQLSLTANFEGSPLNLWALEQSGFQLPSHSCILEMAPDTARVTISYRKSYTGILICAEVDNVEQSKHVRKHR